MQKERSAPIDLLLESIPFGKNDQKAATAWAEQAKELIQTPQNLSTLNKILSKKMADAHLEVVPGVFIDQRSPEEWRRHRSLSWNISNGTGDCRAVADASYALALNFSPKVVILNFQKDELRKGGHSVCCYSTNEGIGVTGINRADNYLPTEHNFKSYSEVAQVLSREYLEKYNQVWMNYEVQKVTPNMLLALLAPKFPFSVNAIQDALLFSQSDLTRNFATVSKGENFESSKS